MKKLHWLLIRSFLGPLFVTFLIVLFIFSMQFLWKYVDDLMGKGLPALTVAQLLAYATSSLVPICIPPAVLLSSIMTMGGLGERSELTPMRSAGLGLFRIMAPLMVVAVLISGISFYFSNNLLPIINLKYQSLLWDVTEKKPALSLKPKVFYNGLEGFTIRVDGKHEDTGELDGVLIFDHRGAGPAAKRVVRAEHGRMKRSKDGNYLMLELDNGRIYDEMPTTGGSKGATQPLLRGKFERDAIRMDLSSLGLKRTDEDRFKEHYKMRTMGQLQAGEDSLLMRYQQRRAEQDRELFATYAITRDTLTKRPLVSSRPVEHDLRRALDPLPDRDLRSIAAARTQRSVDLLKRIIEERESRTSQLAKFRAEWHRKLTLAVACLLFFFIGAPLGAIVRKGGIGVPTVFAISFFLVYHMTSMGSDQLVRSGDLPAWPGMWIASFVLLPIGLFITWKAATDSPLLEADAYARGWDKLRSIFRRRAHTSTVQ